MLSIYRSLPLLALLLLLTTGCDSEKTAEPDSGGQVTVRYMHMGVAADDGDNNPYVMRQFPDAVAEHFPDIALKSEMLPEDPYTKTLLVQLSSGEGPDFFEWWPMRQLEELVAAGYLQDLTGMDMLNRFTPDALEGYTINGKVYGMPKGLSIMATWYNKELFEQHDIDAFPSDWPSFLAACEKLKQAGVTPIVMPDEDRWFIQFGLYQLAASIVYAADPDFDKKLLAGERTFANSPWREVLLMYKSLYDRGYIAPGSLDIGAEKAAALFNNGKAAMMFNGNWDYARLTANPISRGAGSAGGLKSNGGANFQRGFMPLPGNEPDQPLLLSIGPAGGTVINANTRHLSEVLDILAYQFDPDSPLYGLYKQNYDVFPMYKGEDLGIPEFRDYTALSKTHDSVYFSNQAWPVGVADALCRGFQDWIAGHGTVDDILAAMDERLEALRD